MIFFWNIFQGHDFKKIEENFLNDNIQKRTQVTLNNFN